MISSFFLDGTCMERFYNSSPYDLLSKRGLSCMVAKRILIGLTLTAVFAAGYYFTSMAINKTFNPLHLTSQQQIKIFSTVASVIGAAGIIVTGVSCWRAHNLYKINKDGIINKLFSGDSQNFLDLESQY